ncbi:MAG: hypothetical protein IT384_24680 [Deltaproteobacteria bacterium]|nr:hypothetical protein [Deltaproteobacteria bacterium]
MQTGRVVGGKIEVDEPPREGAVVTVLEHEEQEEDWELTPEDEAELQQRIEAARRGELVDAAELWKRDDAARKG